MSKPLEPLADAAQAVLVFAAAFDGPPQRLATDRRCVPKLLAFYDAPTNAMLPRVSLSLLPFARGHRPHLGCWDLEDLLAILSGCRREIARSHCCPDKKHTHAGVAQFTGSELRNGARRTSLGMKSISFVKLNCVAAHNNNIGVLIVPGF